MTQPATLDSPSVSRLQTTSLTSLDRSSKDKSTVKVHNLQTNSDAGTARPASSEICRSPSWTGFGGDKKKESQKRSEKEKKESENRHKRDGDKQRVTDSKSGKRLSKKPPAAMDTQRMPTALRRSSSPKAANSRSSSQDSSSRRSSKEEGRSSIASLASLMGWSKAPSTESSTSTIASEWSNKPSVSALPPQLPKLSGIRDISKSTPPNVSASGFSEVEDQDACEKDILSFTYQLESSINTISSQRGHTKQIKSVRISMPIEPTDTPPSSRGSGGSDNFPGWKGHPPPRSPLRPILVKHGASETSLETSRQETTSDNQQILVGSVPTVEYGNGGYLSQGEIVSESVQSSTTTTATTPKESKTRFPKFSEEYARSLYNRRGYVQQQRMHIQQRSIAGYEDQLAVQRANERAVEQPALDIMPTEFPPTPNDSVESVLRLVPDLVTGSKPRKVGVATKPNGQMDLSSQKLGNLDSRQKTAKTTDDLHISNVQDEKQTSRGDQQLKIVSTSTPIVKKAVSFQPGDDQAFTASPVLAAMPASAAFSLATPKSKANAVEQKPKGQPYSPSAKFPSSESKAVEVKPKPGKLPKASVNEAVPPIVTKAIKKDGEQEDRALQTSSTPEVLLPVIPVTVDKESLSMLKEANDHSVKKVVSFLNGDDQAFTASPTLTSSPAVIAPSPRTSLSPRRSEADEKVAEPDEKSKSNRFSRAFETVNSKRNSILRLPAYRIQRPVYPPSSSSTAKDQPKNAPKPMPRSSTAPELPTIGTQSAQSQPSTTSTKGKESSSQTSAKPTLSETKVGSASAVQSKSPEKRLLEVIVENVDGDALERKPSLKRSHSNPQLNLPSLDFLPELKHQPLPKAKRALPTTLATVTSSSRPSSMISLPTTTSDLNLNLSTPKPLSSPQIIPKPPFSLPNYTGPMGSRRSPLATSTTLTPTLSTTSQMLASSNLNVAGPAINSPLGKAALDMKPIAKMFVICCECQYWHDLPSKVYEAMALPRKIEMQDAVARVMGGKGRDKVIDKEQDKKEAGSTSGNKRVSEEETMEDGLRVEGKLYTTVKCPWCEHTMSTGCCAGWTTVVYLHERHH